MKNRVKIIIVAVLILLVWWLSSLFYKRWDLTSDERYTFSPTTLQVIDDLSSPAEIHVYLTGDLTGNFKILKNETLFLLDEIQRINPKVQYKVINPIKDGLNIDSLRQIGVQDISVPTNDKILRVFPYATISYNDRNTTIPLLSNQKIPIEERALASTDQIEGKFIGELYRLSIEKRKKIGLIVHHDELSPQSLDGFLKMASKTYDIEAVTEPITNGSYSLSIKDLPKLETYDALVIAKPIKPFTDEDKLVLDQYIMNGGKTLWMTESVDAEMDSLFRSDKIVTFPRDPQIKDLLFAYGVRIVPSVVKDLQSAYITLAMGQVGENTTYEQFPWPYFPVSIPSKQNSITKKIGNPIRFEFANPVEIIPRDSVHAEILLTSSPNAQLQKPLTYITFDEINATNPENYPTQEGVYPLAVLLEGRFSSAYKGRYESKEIKNFKSTSPENKMIIIGDGDFAKNHVFRGQPLPLGADKYSMRPDVDASPNVIYGNATFLMNSLDFLVGDETKLSLNAKERQLFLLDKNKIKAERGTWRWVNLLSPLAVIILLGIFLIWLRKKLYTK